MPDNPNRIYLSELFRPATTISEMNEDNEIPKGARELFHEVPDDPAVKESYGKDSTKP